MDTGAVTHSAKPVTLPDLHKMKTGGEKIACLTAYDACFAALEDRAGVDLILVGDSLGMVVQGHDTTVPVTVDDIVYHSRCVARVLQRAFLVADLPFLSFADKAQAVAAAARLMREGGAKMVKLEGDEAQVEVVEHLASQGVPICAHMGLKPQLVHKLGGYKVQGRDAGAAEAMLRNARLLEEAGADILLLECVPRELGARIARQSKVPVIGIGAGPDTDGQILVVHDALDLTVGRKPRFVRNFMDGAGTVPAALERYVGAVRECVFPAAEHCF